MDEKIVQTIASAIYILFGIANLAIYGLSSLSASYLAVVGILCIATGVGIWRKLDFSMWLALPLVFILIGIGILSLYASLSFGGFNPNQSALLLNITLIGYTIASVVLVGYIIIKRKIIFKAPEKREKI